MGYEPEVLLRLAYIQSLIENVDGLLCLYYHLLGIPPSIVTSSATVFDNLDCLHSLAFLNAMQPAMRCAQKL